MKAVLHTNRAVFSSVTYGTVTVIVSLQVGTRGSILTCDIGYAFVYV